ncbi:MAG TPA: ATP-binding protein [Pyrinomonadaceae bacterium]|jgi:predicted kinase|nr:ATP-binding protein [Pyrinomonadaceae bacterium]
MATLILMCGLPGSGKTTRARELELERHALRLTPDEWIARLYGTGLTLPTLDWCRDPVETVQWAVAERALGLGVNVILDFGFWSRSERENFRARAAALGARSEVHFLDATRPVLLARLAARNADLPAYTFPVTETQLDMWWNLFEPPTEDELKRES